MAYLSDLTLIGDGEGSDCGVGILVDGSSSIDANRGFVRDIRLERVGVRASRGIGVELRGNAFDVRVEHCSVFSSGDDCFAMTSSDANIGVGRPSQTYFRDCYTFQGNPQAWDYDVSYCDISGGYVQGYNGIRCG